MTIFDEAAIGVLTHCIDMLANAEPEDGWPGRRVVGESPVRDSGLTN